VGKVEFALPRRREEIGMRQPEPVLGQKLQVSGLLDLLPVCGLFLDRRDWDDLLLRGYDLHLHLQVVGETSVHRKHAFFVHFKFI